MKSIIFICLGNICRSLFYSEPEKVDEVWEMISFGVEDILVNYLVHFDR